MEDQIALTKIRPEDLPALEVGKRIVHVNYTNLRWATIKSVTSKQVTVTVPDYSRHEQIFRLKTFYKGGTVYLEPYGKDSNGYLAFAITDEEIALVEASYTARAEADAAEKARKDEERRKIQETVAREKAEAHEANPDVAFTEIGVQGAVRHYCANVMGRKEEMIFVVASVMRMKETDWDADRDAEGNRPFYWVWKAAVNYTPPADPKYGPKTMGSISEIEGKTLEDLFQAIVERVWRSAW